MGDEGDVGDEGEAGDEGDEGDKGDEEDVGDEGDAGNEGDAGDERDAGDRGDVGAAGASHGVDHTVDCDTDEATGQGDTDCTAEPFGRFKDCCSVFRNDKSMWLEMNPETSTSDVL